MTLHDEVSDALCQEIYDATVRGEPIYKAILDLRSLRALGEITQPDYTTMKHTLSNRLLARTEK